MGRQVRLRRKQAHRPQAHAPKSWSIAPAAIPRLRTNRPAAPSTKPSRSSAASRRISPSTIGLACVWNFGAALGSEVSLASFRKDIYLEFYNEAGQLVIAYKIYRCWVSEYQAMPDLDANANAIAIEHIKLENEGWERDTSVTEPQEPTLTTVST